MLGRLELPKMQTGEQEYTDGQRMNRRIKNWNRSPGTHPYTRGALTCDRANTSK